MLERYPRAPERLVSLTTRGTLNRLASANGRKIVMLISFILTGRKEVPLRLNRLDGIRGYPQKAYLRHPT
jgi:hypothetical protein